MGATPFKQPTAPLQHPVFSFFRSAQRTAENNCGTAIGCPPTAVDYRLNAVAFCRTMTESGHPPLCFWFLFIRQRPEAKTPDGQRYILVQSLLHTAPAPPPPPAPRHNNGKGIIKQRCKAQTQHALLFGQDQGFFS